MSSAPSLPPDREPPDQDRRDSGQPPQGQPPHSPLWRVLGWIGVGILGLILLVAVAITVALHSDWVHNYLLSTVQQKASSALGSDVKVQNYALNFSGISPTIDLYGVTVAGAPPFSNTELLQVEHIRAGVQVVSVLGRKWYLNDLEVHHPVVQLFVDKQGRDNLPKLKSSNNSSSSTNIFDLGVRHAVLDRGEIYYNNKKSALSADLHQLNLQSSFATDQRMYSGTLSYRDGHVVLGNYNPIPHSLDAQFEATPTRFDLRQATLRSGPSRIDLSGTVTDYSNPKFHIEYIASLHTGEFRRILKNDTLPAGVIKLDGSVQYDSQPNVPMLSAMTVQGHLSSNALQIHTAQLDAVVRDLLARYSLNNGNADLSNVQARILGGTVTANASIRNVASKSQQSHVTASLNNIKLAELSAMANSPALKDVSLGGSLDANTEASWGSTIDNLTARANATLDATVKSARVGATGTTNPVPITGAIHARYSGRSKQITLTNSSLRLPQTAVNLNGTVSENSALRISMHSSQLHELETLSDLFRAPSPGKPAQPLGLYGTANFAGAVTGSTAKPHLTGRLTASNLKVKDTSWRSLNADIAASPSHISLQNGSLVPATRGHINFAVSAGLNDWSYTNTSPIQVLLNASQVSLGELAKAAGVQMPLSGTLSANVQAHGSQLNPVGQGEIKLTQAQIEGETIQSADLKFNGNGDALHANGAVRLPAGALDAVLTYFPRQKGYEGRISANGIKLGQLKTIKSKDLGISGVLNLNASGKGTISDPQLTASLTIPELRIKDQTISSISIQTNIDNHVARFALDSSVMNTPIRGRGSVNLTGAYQVDATLDTPTIPIAPFVAAYMPSEAGKLSGKTELHATVHGPLKNKTQLEAHATIPVLALQYQNTVQIGAPNPIRIDYVNGVLSIQRASLRGTDTNLEFQGTIPVTEKNAPVSLLAVGTIDLRLAQLFNPDLTSSGQLRFDINSYGQRSDPNVEGQIRIVDASLVMPGMPVGLSNGNGVLTLTKDRLVVSSMTGTVGGGSITMRGGILYRPSVQFDLAVSGKDIRLLLPVGIRTGLNTNMALTGTLDSSTLQGQVDVEQLSFTPDFDIASAIGQMGGPSTPPSSQGFADNLQLNLAVRSTGGINLVSREVTVQGTANLTVRGTAANPVVTGRVNVSSGDLVFRGNRYVLQNGTVDFVNPSRTEAVVNMSINTTVQQYNIEMRLEGPVDRLRTNYTSDPALPPADIINLLAFGKTTESAAANPNPSGTLGAQSVIASAVSGEVTDRIQKIAGISHLSIDPTLGGNQQNPGARVTIQQRVTGKIFVTFSTDVTGTQREVIQVQYRKSPRLSFTGTRDQNGGFAFDTRIRKNW